jgi:4'-phosphopantetheinyl transferase
MSSEGGETKWVAAPTRVRLDDGEVHAWRAELGVVEDDVARWLSPDECERMARFVDPEHGRRWARARGVLRVLLGRYLDADPAGLRFSEGEHGKPALASAEADGLEFNVSHSADVALYAVARGRSVGVDVEVARRPVDAVAIARRMLGEEAAQRLAALDDEERERAFLRAWTRHEAALKCRGTGIGGAAVGARPDEGLWIVDLDVGPGATAALAVDGPPSELRCFDWSE